MKKSLIHRIRYRRLFALIAVILLVVGSIFAYAYTRINATKPVAPRHERESGKVTVMVMGVDSRKDDVGRSDTLMLFTVDKGTGDVSVLSIPRDTRVKIPGHGYDKINAAYAYGGQALTKKTVENLLDVTVDYYVVVRIKAFEKIINDIGGVDIDVKKRMYYNDPWDDNGGLHINFYPGMQHMDGAKAIEYVRYRDTEGDIGRIQRQQYFMQQVLKKVLTPAILPKLPSIINEASGAVTTNMSVAQMLDFAKLLPDMKGKKIMTSMLPGTPAYIKDMSYWLPDIKKARAIIDQNLGIAVTDKMQQNTQLLMDEYKKSLPGDLKIVNGTYDYEDYKNEFDGNQAQKKQPSEKEAPKEQKSLKPSQITVRVINSSGINGAGAQVVSLLQRKGFKVLKAENGAVRNRQKTTITAGKGSINMFYGMPFPCTLMVGGSDDYVTVDIGRDYRK